MFQTKLVVINEIHMVVYTMKLRMKLQGRCVISCAGKLTEGKV